MSLKEETTDGLTGMNAAEKYKSENLPKPQDGYDGYSHGSSSVQNNASKSVEKKEGESNSEV